MRFKLSMNSVDEAKANRRLLCKIILYLFEKNIHNRSFFEQENLPSALRPEERCPRRISGRISVFLSRTQTQPGFRIILTTLF
jgi:hypothetical protein